MVTIFPNSHDSECHLIQTKEKANPGLEVKATKLGNHEFRVEVDGVIMDVRLAVYSKVNQFFYMLV